MPDVSDSWFNKQPFSFPTCIEPVADADLRDGGKLAMKIQFVCRVTFLCVFVLKRMYGWGKLPYVVFPLRFPQVSLAWLW